MKCVMGIFLLILPAMAVAQTGTNAPPSVPVDAPNPVAMKVAYYPGQTVRYAFSLKVNLTSRVQARAPYESVVGFTPRRYEVSGELIATFPPAPPGEALHGTLRFEGLAVKNWASTANVAEVEESLRQLETTSAALAARDDGALQIAGWDLDPLHNHYYLDVVNLHSLAYTLLRSHLSKKPLAPGQQSEWEDLFILAMAKLGIKRTVLAKYVTNVPIAQRSNAEVQLTVNVPNQGYPLSAPSLASKALGRLHGGGVSTYLLDLETHHISFLHGTFWTEIRCVEEITNSDESMRVPLELFTVNNAYEASARRVASNAPPEGEADLSAFEKSLAAPAGGAPDGSVALASAPPSGESLGDIARRLRAERAAQPPPKAEMTLTGSSAPSPAPAETTLTARPAPAPPRAETRSSATDRSAPPTFRLEPFPSGDAVLRVPDQARTAQQAGLGIRLIAVVGTPPTAVAISLMDMASDAPTLPPDELLDDAVKAMREKQGFHFLTTEKKSINGEPGVVAEVQIDPPTPPFKGLLSIVIVRGKAFLAICGSLPNDYAKVESLCRTVVESTRAQ